MPGPSPSLILPGVVFPAPSDDIARRWLTVVHQVARATNWRIASTRVEPAVGRSYYGIVVTGQDGSRTLTLNPAARVVAFVLGEHPFPATATYVPVVGRDQFLETGFIVPSVDELEAPLRKKDLEGLTKYEAGQVRYHRPARVGDVVFNWFD